MKDIEKEYLELELCKEDKHKWEEINVYHLDKNSFISEDYQYPPLISSKEERCIKCHLPKSIHGNKNRMIEFVAEKRANKHVELEFGTKYE